jgi:hypothetical protein
VSEVFSVNPFRGIVRLLQRSSRPAIEDITGIPATSEEPPQASDPLRNTTPHLLAAAMLQSVVEGGQPWRESDPAALAIVAASVPMTCEFYQLSIFFDLIGRRFGDNVCNLCEASLLAIISRAKYPDFYSKFKTTLSEAKVSSGYDVVGAATELDREIARRFLLVFAESEESKKALLQPLAACLSYARIWAEAAYPEIVSRVSFDPLSIAMVEIETSYKGTSTFWQAEPGCFERQLQRMEGNPLYDEALRFPSEAQVLEARAKDLNDLMHIEIDVARLFADFEKLGDVGAVESHILIDLLQHNLEPLLVRCAEVGLPARKQSKALRTVLQATLKAIGLDEEEQVELGKTRNFLTNPLVAQHFREGGPMPKDGLVEALLAEDVETIAQVLLAYEERDPTVIQELSELALTLLELCELESFNLPGIHEKKTLFSEFGSLGQFSRLSH